MDTGALEILDICVPQNDGHLTPYDGDQFQLFMDAAFLIVQSGGKDVRVAPEHRGIVFHQHAFHAIRINGFKVGDVAHHLANGPFTGHGSQIQLVLPHARDGGFEQIGAIFVVFQQFIQSHGFRFRRGISASRGVD